MNGKKILVVEDSRSFRQQVSIALESRNYEVVEASNGLEGLDALSQHSDISVIITDINMPEMGGLAMVRKIREEAAFSGPLMILTTEGGLEIIEEGRSLGVNCWLVKPFKPSVLVAAIDRLLEDG